MVTVFKKVMVSDIHVGKWMFYITPCGFKGYGEIEAPTFLEGLYRCNDTYAQQVLEEIELPSDEEIDNESYPIDTTNESTAFIIGANYILNKLK